MDPFQIIRRSHNQDEILSAIDAANINIVDQNRQNLLHAAIACNQTAPGIELINQGIDVNQQDDRGMTPLHYAAWYQNATLAELILQNGGDPAILDKHGNTPLWYAVFYARGNYALVRLLQKAGKQAKTKNRSGKSPLDFAGQIGDSELINLLKEE